jgi:hypothetical protein
MIYFFCIIYMIYFFIIFEKNVPKTVKLIRFCKRPVLDKKPFKKDAIESPNDCISQDEVFEIVIIIL